MALIGLILMHSGRDTGMGGMGFTPASQGGTHIVERNLTRLTVVVAALFLVPGAAHAMARKPAVVPAGAAPAPVAWPRRVPLELVAPGPGGGTAARPWRFVVECKSPSG